MCESLNAGNPRTVAASRDYHPVANCIASPLLTVLPTEKNLLLGWRDWFGGAASEPLGLRVGWRSSLACLLGALAAAPGSVAMLAHRLIAFRAALARGRFRFQAVIEFFGFLCFHHSHIGNVRSA
jgi:hypothetical protein